MNKKLLHLTMLFTLVMNVGNAQEKPSITIDEVVVSDTKFAQAKEKSGKIIEVLTAKELATKKGQNLAVILSQLAGVEINGSQSSGGKNLGYYIRGGRNRQTAIYIDGIPVTDASGINLEYDLRLIPVEQIEKIEVMKGASSTLYGTGAATGVINITLKKPLSADFSGNAYLNLGTQNTSVTSKTSAQDMSQGLTINGTLQKISYLTTLNRIETKGISEAAGVNFEEDVFSRFNVLQKIGYKINDRLQLDFFGNYDRIKNTFDNAFDGTISHSDDTNNNSLSEQFRIGFLPKYNYKKGEFTIHAGASTIQRTVAMSNSWSGGIDSFIYAGRTASVDAYNTYTVHKKIHVVIGTQYQYLDMSQKDNYTAIERNNTKFSIIDPYATFVINSDSGFHLNLGSRLNTHSSYGKQWVYNINPSYAFKTIALKLVSSYSTAYITPSLYQLNGPYGNDLLTPEKNATAEFGFESYFFAKKVQINAVGFYREEQNTIGFYYNPLTFQSAYINVIGKYKARGIETTVRYALSKKINFQGNYTFNQVQEPLNRLIPKHKVNADLKYVFQRGLLNLQYQFVDKREDIYYDSSSWTSQNVSLRAYQLINATYSYDLLPNRLQVFATVTNVLNANFQEVVGYNTKGRNFKIGLTVLF